MGVITNLWSSKSRPHEQFEALIGPHMKRLYNLAYRFTGQRDDAEDLVQDLLLKLYPRLEEMQSIDKLSPWLSRVIYRQFIDGVRRKKRSPIEYMDNEEAIYETQASDEEEPSAVVNTELTQDYLNNALNQLNEDQRILLLLHDVEGYGLQEINDMIDVPVGTLKSRLSRARKKLREIVHIMEPELEPGRVNGEVE